MGELGRDSIHATTPFARVSDVSSMVLVLALVLAVAVGVITAFREQRSRNGNLPISAPLLPIPLLGAHRPHVSPADLPEDINFTETAAENVSEIGFFLFGPIRIVHPGFSRSQLGCEVQEVSLVVVPSNDRITPQFSQAPNAG